VESHCSFKLVEDLKMVVSCFRLRFIWKTCTKVQRNLPLPSSG